LVRFYGRVQGVGFRYTTRSLAARLPVTGYVRNLPDGSVELVVEGAAADVERLLQGIAGELGQYIRSQDLSVQPSSGQFSTFEIEL
jgi:acylphosphatase